MMRPFSFSPRGTPNYPGLAVWCSCMIHIGRWAFGLSIDVWTTGYDIMVGLGPWQPRLVKLRSGHNDKIDALAISIAVADNGNDVKGGT